MNFEKCFDTFISLANEMTSNGDGQSLSENHDRKNKIEKVCDELDKFILEFDGYEYEITIDKITQDIEFSVVFEEFKIEDISDGFYEIVKESKEISLSFIDFEHLKISFIFDGIWEDKTGEIYECE